MSASLVAWAIGVPLLALALSFVALNQSRKEAAEIRALEATEKRDRTLR